MGTPVILGPALVEVEVVDVEDVRTAELEVTGIVVELRNTDELVTEVVDELSDRGGIVGATVIEFVDAAISVGISLWVLKTEEELIGSAKDDELMATSDDEELRGSTEPVDDSVSIVDGIMEELLATVIVELDNTGSVLELKVETAIVEGEDAALDEGEFNADELKVFD